MKELEFSIDLFYIRPELEPKNFTYRLYLDDHLITERTWIWDDKVFIREHIPVCLHPGKHTYRVETPEFDPTIKVVSPVNTQINGHPIPRFKDEFIIE